MAYNVELKNKTAVQKQQNEKFKQYLIHTKTTYSTKEEDNDILFEIETDDISSVKNALDKYIYCTENGHIAYAY